METTMESPARFITQSNKYNHVDKVNDVYRTKDYSLFSTCIENRDIRRKHVENLKQSFMERQVPVPIIVDEKHRIHDGQHRYTACMELGIYIYYICIPGLDTVDIKLLNATMKAWQANDYACFYIKQGNVEYQKFLDFRDQYGFGVRESIQLLIGERANKDVENIFKDGELVCSDEANAHKKAKMIEEVKPYHERYKTRAFVNAMMILFFKPEYDHKRFISKLKRQSLRLTDQVTENEYRLVIEKIYNSGCKKINHVRLSDALVL